MSARRKLVLLWSTPRSLLRRCFYAGLSVLFELQRRKEIADKFICYMVLRCTKKNPLLGTHIFFYLIPHFSPFTPFTPFTPLFIL